MPTSKNLIVQRTGIALILLLSLTVILMSLRFFSFERMDILLGKPDHIYNSLWYKVSFYTHVSMGMIALLTGPFQFMPRLRTNRLTLHRRIGKVYILACGLGGVTGLIIAFFAQGGLMGQIGFLTMSLAWLTCTYLAWRSILEKKIVLHQKWMIRSFAVTFAAVTLRLGLIFVAVGMVEFNTIYPFLAWFSWVGNLVFVELLIIPSAIGK